MKAGTPGAEKVRQTAEKWYGQGIPGYPPGKGVPLSADKRTAERMLAEWVARGELGKVALPDPAAGRKTLADHLAVFERDAAAGLGRRAGRDDPPSATQVALTVQRVRAILGGCGFRSVADLTGGAAARTLAEYLRGRAVAPVGGVLLGGRQAVRVVAGERGAGTGPGRPVPQGAAVQAEEQPDPPPAGGDDGRVGPPPRRGPRQ